MWCLYKLDTNDFKIVVKWKNQDWDKYFKYKHSHIVEQNELYNKMMKCEDDDETDIDEDCPSPRSVLPNYD
jgi:hypothetical protein